MRQFTKVKYLNKHNYIIESQACNNGTCNQQGICIPRVNNTYECRCIGGFSGSNCSTPPDPCLLGTHLCPPFAICVSSGENNASYSCQCPEYKTGPYCKRVIGEFSSLDHFIL